VDERACSPEQEAHAACLRASVKVTRIARRRGRVSDSEVSSVDQVDRLAREVMRRLGGELRRGATAGSIPIGISVRHIHIARGVLDRLFGEGHQLAKLRDLGQPGEFAARETVTILGPSMRAVEGVRIVGPIRTYTQIEVSRTDAVRLGLDPPVRRSGDLVGSEPLTVVGPAGTVALKEGLIRSTRHIHMTKRDADVHGVKDQDLVRVRFPGQRALVLENVLIRVGKNAALELHIDTDDANAADVRLPMSVEILR
jgi:putative phosphotransacetylase